MELGYYVNFCLRGESYFEDSHPSYDKIKNELYLNVSEIIELIDLCESELDSVGISFPGEEPGKWDALEVHGIDGKSYKLEYQIGRSGGSYIKGGVLKEEICPLLNEIKKPMKFFKECGYTYTPW
ncbi:hypothetical protein BTA51_22785 [Hahella sp. CCB-MM4]|uniref:hypothetical protein n=1 Tax=Hahella sp. (strain CCB-MM4) TaxID=1926491 RepID=UPI000B9C1C83|nr:hypothetical protein [Hahella sp. CCB-MM4]OZG70937.1 hypothetical protein BTA51_22785 [Hahella sp. CCB-MM4]